MTFCQHIVRILLIGWTTTLLLGFISPRMSHAAEGGLIRDAEIEYFLGNITAPLLEAAAIEASSVNLFIINKAGINAFVAGGNNIFIHTGLLMDVKSPEMLAGVTAHEIGHIVGGHLASGSKALSKARIGTVLTYILGAAAAVAGGGGDAAMAVITAGQGVTSRGVISHIRENEQYADQSALNLLDRAGISAQPMLNLFEILRRKEQAKLDDIDPYTLTHPLSKERIAHIRSYINQHRYSSATEQRHRGKYPAKIKKSFERVQAKLEGFLKPPSEVISKYKKEDKTIRARYARSIAFHKRGETDKAIRELDSIIRELPDDAFLYELKGQILFESGRIDKAIEAYGIALKKANPAKVGDNNKQNDIKNKYIAIMRTSHAQALLAKFEKTGDREALELAVKELEASAHIDKIYYLTWKLLAKAYGSQGKLGYMNLAQAEMAALDDDMEKALEYCRKAIKLLKENSPAYLRAKDLETIAQKAMDEAK